MLNKDTKDFLSKAIEDAERMTELIFAIAAREKIHDLALMVAVEMIARQAESQDTQRYMTVKRIVQAAIDEVADQQQVGNK
jgi:hypothetical protein